MFRRTLWILAFALASPVPALAALQAGAEASGPAPHPLAVAASRASEAFGACLNARLERDVESATSEGAAANIALLAIQACGEERQSWQQAAEAFIASDAVPAERRAELRSRLEAQLSYLPTELEAGAREAIHRRLQPGHGH